MKAESLVWAGQVALVFEKHRMSVSSWGRSEIWNYVVGGSVDPPSKHTTWDAIDGTTIYEEDARACFDALKAKKLGYGYVKKRGRRKYPTGKMVSVWQIHIQRLPVKKKG